MDNTRSKPYLGNDIFSEEKSIREARKLVVPSFETTVEELTPELISIPDRDRTTERRCDNQLRNVRGVIPNDHKLNMSSIENKYLFSL